MPHYKANLRDMEFNLFEVLDLAHLLDKGAYGDLDTDTARSILDEIRHLAEGPLAESFVDADRNPTEFDAANHAVVVPEQLHKTVAMINDAGWSALGMPEPMGGVAAPRALVWAAHEMLIAANSSAAFFNMGPIMHDVLFREGTAQQQRWATHAWEHRWAGTMVLTEPDAGSDVGMGRTKAIAQPDGTWHIEGIKRFISGGDVGDTADNIFHLVLARPEGAGPGTKGLSLFLVPKFRFDPDTMELGPRNGVFVTNLEHKMGIKSAPTCELTFGGHGLPAVGWLVGEVHNGIAQMFQVIENARMLVGTMSCGTLSSGYLNALEFAKTRVQGADMAQMLDKTAPRVTIVNHPDVRRSLILQKAYAEGLRALYMYCASYQDTDVAAANYGIDPELAMRVNDLLLPIVKGVGSERSYEILTESLQTFGGSGYLQDYPIEQYIRDVKIDTLYEGTTAIQALDFFFRKIVRDQSVALDHVVEQIEKFVSDGPIEDPLETERTLLGWALQDVLAMISCLTGYTITSATDTAKTSEIYKAGLGSVRLLNAAGELIIAWRLLVHARIALTALAAEPDATDSAFYTGKVVTAQWFAANHLPLLAGMRTVLETLDLGVMKLDEAAF
ncbi:acyl-CoA dehydrogenase [Nocardia sp. NPDC005825]|uniref:acyl-CoA dehydrogenase n=1 Tax=unclassified Nocardia TaxID=2637762 RepID=UPI0033FC9452